MTSRVDAALKYLQEHHVITIATHGDGGTWAAAVFYASQGFKLYFLSAKHTRHVASMTDNPRVAATIQEDYAEWAAIKGIQLEGVVTQLSGTARTAAIEQYSVKFPFLAEAPAEIRAAFRQVSWYQLTPDRLYFIDNSRGFGHRDRIL